MPKTVSTTGDPESIAYGRELHATIESAIDSIPPLYRSVFVLRDIEELTGGSSRVPWNIGGDCEDTIASSAPAPSSPTGACPWRVNWFFVFFWQSTM